MTVPATCRTRPSTARHTEAKEPAVLEPDALLALRGPLIGRIRQEQRERAGHASVPLFLELIEHLHLLGANGERRLTDHGCTLYSLLDDQCS
jgi:hypothetical protein